jgi:hypothetical protein
MQLLIPVLEAVVAPEAVSLMAGVPEELAEVELQSLKAVNNI